MSYQHIKVPAEGHAISANEDLSLNVPDNPVIPFIEGDGIGADISPVMIKVVDSAVENAYQGGRRFHGWKYLQERRQPRCMVKTNGFPKSRCKR